MKANVRCGLALILGRRVARATLLLFIVICCVHPAAAAAVAAAPDAAETATTKLDTAAADAAAPNAAEPATVDAVISDEPDILQLSVGESQVLSLAGVRRVAVGHGDVLHAVVVDERQVVIFGRAAGTSSLHIWTNEGPPTHYLITVLAAGLQRMRDDLRALLESVPNAQAAIVGDSVVVQGDYLSDADRARIAALSQRYPQIVDFTSAVGWDRMVMLDVQVVELPRARMRELGIKWDGTTGGITLGVSWDAPTNYRWVGPDAKPASTPDATRRGWAGHAGFNTQITSRINALAEAGEALILAQPQLLARSGATADFLAGGEVPYATVDRDGKTTTAFKPYGVSLKMTPHIERNGIIRSHIAVEASAVDASVSGSNGPALKTRRAATEFNVMSGRTLVLAGFLSHERSSNRNGLPGLMDLPFVGGLFGVRRETQRDTELAIFVTPTIVSDSHPALQMRVERANTLISTSRAAPLRMNVPLEQRPAYERGLSSSLRGPAQAGHERRRGYEASLRSGQSKNSARHSQGREIGAVPIKSNRSATFRRAATSQLAATSGRAATVSAESAHPRNVNRRTYRND